MRVAAFVLAMSVQTGAQEIERVAPAGRRAVVVFAKATVVDRPEVKIGGRRLRVLAASARAVVVESPGPGEHEVELGKDRRRIAIPDAFPPLEGETEIEWTSAGEGVLRIRTKDQREFVVAVLDEGLRVDGAAAVVVRTEGGAVSLPVSARPGTSGEIVVCETTSFGTAVLSAVPPPVAEESGWRWNPFDPPRAAGLDVGFDVLFLPNRRTDAEFERSFDYDFTPSVGSFEPDEYQGTGFSIRLRLDLDLFDVKLRFDAGEGKGEGKATVNDGFMDFQGELEFDVRWMALSILLGREVGGYYGTGWRIVARVEAGAGYRWEEYDNLKFLPDDPILPVAEVPGSETEKDFFGVVRLSPEFVVELGKGWRLAVSAGVDFFFPPASAEFFAGVAVGIGF
ncbi:MAG: hypothetical protein HYY17_10620 [Planctomycetes bacterium]|nr:hypothetical protein [Planctomycetota bacterium]